jgi:hypothetical protein
VGVSKLVLIPMIALASCSDTRGRSGTDDNRPLANDKNAEIAAGDCGIEDWRWAWMVAFDAPQPEEPYFAYELESLPLEEIEPELAGGRSWDRTERIETINACLTDSFEEQGVRVGLTAPGLVETVIDGASPTNASD